MKMTGFFILKHRKMKVLKFGGTSVGSAKKIEKITEIIHARMPVFVILSAMAGTTDALAGLAGDVTNGQKGTARKSVQIGRAHV